MGNKVYHGQHAVKMMEQKLKRPLDIAEKRVIEEEGYVATPYKDTKGVITSGVGQTGKYRNMSFQDTFNAHSALAEKMIPSLYRLPDDVRAELVQATYRGDLTNSPKFRKLFNAGKYAEAAKEFLNNEDYRQSKKDKTGVAARMERVAEAVASMENRQEVASLDNELLQNPLMAQEQWQS